MKTLALLLLLLPAGTAEGSKIVRTSMGGDIDVDAAPHGARLRTMGGDIRVTRADGEVVAKTMGGNIRVDRLNGSLDAGTLGGNVEVVVVGAGQGRDIEIRSLGGHIEVTFPRNFSGDFDVELEQDDHGHDHEIVSDFPLEMRESTRRHWFRKVGVSTATGKIGAGGNRVRISTIGGNIVLRRK
jgi:DUF4097 and DUF4098 domain-containing protein YvlB